MYMCTCMYIYTDSVHVKTCVPRGTKAVYMFLNER